MMERGDWPAASSALSQALTGSQGKLPRAAHYLAAVLLLQARDHPLDVGWEQEVQLRPAEPKMLHVTARLGCQDCC